MQIKAVRTITITQHGNSVHYHTCSQMVASLEETGSTNLESIPSGQEQTLTVQTISELSALRQSEENELVLSSQCQTAVSFQCHKQQPALQKTVFKNICLKYIIQQLLPYIFY